MVGVQQKSGVRRSPDLRAQTTPLRCHVQTDLTRRKAVSASSLRTCHACLYHREEMHTRKRPFSNQPGPRIALCCLGRDSSVCGQHNPKKDSLC